MSSDVQPDVLDRRPRARRHWLLLPFALVVLLLAGWSVWWFVVKGQVEARLNAEAERLRQSGWTVQLADRRVAGFPFRLRVEYREAQLTAPNGWGASIPGLQAQAYLHAPDHWVLVAPKGLTFVRPKGGPVSVTGDSLRASIVGIRQPIWRIAAEGRGLRFAPDPHAMPFALASAALVDAYLQPTDKPGEARWLVRVQDGRAAPNALLGVLARDKPVQSRGEGRLTRLDAWKTPPAGGARANWAAAGGTLQMDRAELDAGAVTARLAEPSSLTLDAEGRLRGVLPIEFKPPLAAVDALGATDVAREAADLAARVLGGRAGADSVRLSIVFEAGATTLGPVRLGPSPKLF